eukprot:6176213-Pleurochrysis_carterae.AAC.1
MTDAFCAWGCYKLLFCVQVGGFAAARKLSRHGASASGPMRCEDACLRTHVRRTLLLPLVL